MQPRAQFQSILRICLSFYASADLFDTTWAVPAQGKVGGGGLQPLELVCQNKSLALWTFERSSDVSAQNMIVLTVYNGLNTS